MALLEERLNVIAEVRDAQFTIRYVGPKNRT